MCNVFGTPFLPSLNRPEPQRIRIPVGPRRQVRRKVWPISYPIAMMNQVIEIIREDGVAEPRACIVVCHWVEVGGAVEGPINSKWKYQTGTEAVAGNDARRKFRDVQLRPTTRYKGDRLRPTIF